MSTDHINQPTPVPARVCTAAAFLSRGRDVPVEGQSLAQLPPALEIEITDWPDGSAVTVYLTGQGYTLQWDFDVPAHGTAAYAQALATLLGDGLIRVQYT